MWGGMGERDKDRYRERERERERELKCLWRRWISLRSFLARFFTYFLPPKSVH
jgi:hypothetical protein